MKLEGDLVALSLALIGSRAGLSASERQLAASCKSRARASEVSTVAEQIRLGADPLGEAFLQLRSAARRRADGAIYTPDTIVRSMTNWIADQCTPARVVDPGAGSGRYLLSAGRAFPGARLVAVEMDPLAALMLRANLAVLGWSRRAEVLVADYREVSIAKVKGVTAFLGNPPYVRHHGIQPKWKTWYSREFASMGIKASALAGLHLHFFLQTCRLAQTGDVGTFITSSEWMDVNYGAALRKLLLERMGGTALHVLEPTVAAFSGTATTAAIACFKVGDAPSHIRVRSVGTMEALNGLTKGTGVPRAELGNAAKWSIIVRPSGTSGGPGIELGELFRVHRGQVTGANGIWIAGEHSALLPDRFKLPTVTRARDLIAAGEKLQSASQLRSVIDLPTDWDHVAAKERRAIAAFLKWAKAQGGDESYIARHRRAWWSVGLRPPAPILCTYMARRPPQFTLNACEARHINIAHGLYPREDLEPAKLANIVSWLNANVSSSCGRTYAGGLTKFEPREVERLRLSRELAA